MGKISSGIEVFFAGASPDEQGADGSNNCLTDLFTRLGSGMLCDYWRLFEPVSLSHKIDRTDLSENHADFPMSQYTCSHVIGDSIDGNLIARDTGSGGMFLLRAGMPTLSFECTLESSLRLVSEYGSADVQKVWYYEKYTDKVVSFDRHLSHLGEKSAQEIFEVLRTRFEATCFDVGSRSFVVVFDELEMMAVLTRQDRDVKPQNPERVWWLKFCCANITLESKLKEFFAFLQDAGFIYR